MPCFMFYLLLFTYAFAFSYAAQLFFLPLLLCLIRQLVFYAFFFVSSFRAFLGGRRKQVKCDPKTAKKHSKNPYFSSLF